MTDYEDSMRQHSTSKDLNEEEDTYFPQKREAPDTELTTEGEPSNHVKSISPAGAIHSNNSQSKNDGTEIFSHHIEEKRKRSKKDVDALVDVTCASHYEASVALFQAKRNIQMMLTKTMKNINSTSQAMEDIDSNSQTEGNVDTVVEVTCVSRDEASVALYQTKGNVNDAIEKIVARDITMEDIRSPSIADGPLLLGNQVTRNIFDDLSTRTHITQIADQPSRSQPPFTPSHSSLPHIISPFHPPLNLDHPIPPHITFSHPTFQPNNIIPASPRRWNNPSQSYDRIRQHQRGMHMFQPSSKRTIPAYENDYLISKIANLRFGPHSDNDASEKEPPSTQTAVACLLCGDNISFVLDCSHPFCTTCLKQYVQAQIDLGKSAHIVCPMPHAECGKEILQRELQTILGKEKFAKIDRFALESATDADPNLRYCPTPDCPYIAYWEEQLKDGTVSLPKFFCPLCDSTSCLKCSISPYHEGVSCDIFQSMPASCRNEQLTRSYIELNKAQMRPCGRCGTVVMKKEGGCAKMKCRCGYRFCFVCGIENATCGHTPAHHGFTDNITGHGDFVDLKNEKSPT